MKHPISLITIAVLLAANASAQQNTAYVTDVLRLGLHAAADTSDRAFRSLESGQAMQIIERNRNYARVRLPDGTEGWVKAGFLVDEKPARLIVAEVQAQSDALRAELDGVRTEFSGSAGRIASLESSLATAEQRVSQLSAQYDEAREINAGYEKKMRLYGFRLPWPIAVGAMLITLVLGCAAGFWGIDSRSRKRHGGFRIY